MGLPPWSEQSREKMVKINLRKQVILGMNLKSVWESEWEKWENRRWASIPYFHFVELNGLILLHNQLDVSFNNQSDAIHAQIHLQLCNIWSTTITSCGNSSRDANHFHFYARICIDVAKERIRTIPTWWTTMNQIESMAILVQCLIEAKIDQLLVMLGPYWDGVNKNSHGKRWEDSCHGIS